MKKIQLAKLDKYQDNPRYEHVEGNIYKDLKETFDANHVFALSYELEDGEDSQYPLEDILDKYFFHVSDFLNQDPDAREVTVELGGTLEDINRAIDDIVGKRAYNEDYSDENGQMRVRLVIE